MHRNYIYFVLALTAACLSFILIFFLQKPGKEEVIEVQTERPPFLTYISGVGIVEPKSGNIHVSSNFNRVVEKINVSINQEVKKGDVLFELYRDDLIAQLKIKQQDYEKGLARLQKLQALPRSEDLAVANEVLDKTQARLSEAKAQYDMVSNLTNPRAISKEEQDKRYYKYQQAEAELKEAQAQFQKIKSGAWQPELKIALHEVQQLKAGVDAAELEVQRTYVKSPLNATVLKIDIHEGEIVDPNQAAMVLGDIEELYLRVSIDQYNITMFDPKGSAIAFRRGDHTTEFPLKLIRVDPIMVPKKYLTNNVDEKVDSHVAEIIYSITNKDAGLLVGEQMDVYIDAEKK